MLGKKFANEAVWLNLSFARIDLQAIIKRQPAKEPVNPWSWGSLR
jgi:hypothetical protein